MNKPWLNSYPAEVPEFLPPLEYQSLADFVEQTTEKYADRPAFTNFGITLTYAGMEEKSRFFSSFLLSLGLKKLDRVAIMLPNILQYPPAFLGIVRAGLIVVNVNPLYTARELNLQLCDSGASAIIILENFAHVLEAALAGTSLNHVIVTGLGDLYPFPKSLATNLAVKYIRKRVPEYRLPGAIPFRNALKIGKNKDFHSQAIEPDDIALLQYTGGTTGYSKGAMLTHRNILSNVQQAAIWITHGNPPGKEILPGNETVITALPLYHIFALTANFLTFFNLGANNVLITNPRDLKGFVKELQSHPFTCITGVNTLYDGLLNTHGFEQLDFSHLKVSLAGGMSTRKEIAARWNRTTGSPLIESYGLTEASPAVAINPLDHEFTGSVGLPLPSTNCEIRDEDGNRLPFDEEGELFVYGPQVMKGYWKQPQETGKERLSSGWLKTGDIARIDKQGYIYIVDRKKDMILVSGFNVYPNEVEAVISSHPDVIECGAIGIPDQRTGEAVKVFVVASNPSLNKKDLLQFCRLNLAAYKIPKIIEFRKNLPKSTVGKILRKTLRDD